MVDIRKLFAHRNRGILLDVVIFIVNLTLMRVLVMLSMNLVRRAEDEDRLAKLAVGLFFAVLFFLQPLGPILKRWSFHQRYRSFQLGKSENAGCLLFWYMFFYIVMMLCVSGAASIIVSEAVFGRYSDWGLNIGGVCILGGFVLSFVNAVIVYRYFLTPKKEPRWKFLTSPQAELLGDASMFLNVICFQILWGCIIASEMFWESLHPTSHGKAPGFFGGLVFKLLVVCVTALLVYFPPRIFYLVIDQHRKITWLTMLLANLPLIVGVIFFSSTAARPRQPIAAVATTSSIRQPLNNPSFKVTAEDFYQEYKLDFQAGAKKYAGKYVNVTGRVHSLQTTKGNSRGSIVRLDGGGFLQWVNCRFEGGDQETIRVLEKNQKVTLQGIGDDFWIGGPALKSCVLVDAQW